MFTTPSGMSFADWRPAGTIFEVLDSIRRWQGQALTAMGAGPVESPWRAVLRRPGLTLRAYSPTGAGPAVLVVPAPIKGPEIWDLAPPVSAVGQMIRGGLQVYLVQWHRPAEEHQAWGLAEYADAFLNECLDVVRRETHQPTAFVAGHSLGGTLAAIFAALHPQQVQGLILLGAPLAFGSRTGAFGPATTAAPPVELLTAMLGNVPGTVLDLLALSASPHTFLYDRTADLLRSLPDAEALHRHWQVECWTLDEHAMARRLFEEVVGKLYRDDRFLRGRLEVAGRRAAPREIRAPILTVLERHSAVVPPDAVLPLCEAAGSTSNHILWYEGETGVALQHVGMLVGRTAHRTIWPEIIRWMQQLA